MATLTQPNVCLQASTLSLKQLYHLVGCTFCSVGATGICATASYFCDGLLTYEHEYSSASKLPSSCFTYLQCQRMALRFFTTFENKIKQWSWPCTSVSPWEL